MKIRDVEIYVNVKQISLAQMISKILFFFHWNLFNSKSTNLCKRAVCTGKKYSYLGNGLVEEPYIFKNIKISAFQGNLEIKLYFPVSIIIASQKITLHVDTPCTMIGGND